MFKRAALVMLMVAPSAAAQSDFIARCAGCHGADANGGERAQGIRRDRTDAQLADIIRRGIPSAGMPAFDLPAGDWPTYNGRLGGNRHSPLAQIDTGNVARLAPRWIFSIPGSQHLEV